ncbi:MAG: sporulation transcription factor Spo0A [Christensenellales bacterium]|jgi:two-component system response regulator (stage 0 sporulation protein A)
MSEKVKLLIVEDNLHLQGIMKDYFKRRQDIDVVATAEDGRQAVQILKTQEVDVMVLDIIMPQLDGFGVLEKMQSETIIKQPQTIVLSALGQEYMIRRACELGARYYMVKPFDMELLSRRIIELSGKSDMIRVGGPFRDDPMVRSMDEKITGVFLMVGIPAHIKGYQFLREAIRMTVQNNDLINKITKELYPGIANKYNTSSSKVERAIRHAIEVAWTRGKIENINQIFGYSIYTKNDKPTNGEFIALVADKILMDQKTA